MALGAVGVTKLLPRGTFRLSAGQPAAVAFILCGAVAYFSLEGFLPLALTAIHDTPIVTAGLILSGGTIFGNLGTWVQARQVRRVGGVRLLLYGAVVLFAGTTLTSLCMTPASVPPVLVALTWASVTLGMGLTSSTASLLVMEYATKGSEGRDSSAGQFATLLGGALGTAFAGLELSSAAQRSADLTGDLRIVGVAAAAFAALGIVAAGRTGSRRPHTLNATAAPPGPGDSTYT